MYSHNHIFIICSNIHAYIHAQITSRMAGGAGELLKSFKLFSSGKGEIGPHQLMNVVQVCMCVYVYVCIYGCVCVCVCTYIHILCMK